MINSTTHARTEDFMAKPFALLSVTDKTGIVEFAKGLTALGFGILSTGGTAKTLRDSGVSVTDVAEYTGSPEILDGRVKTLHPKVHGAILCDRDNPAHVSEAFKHGIGTISVVCVNLYNFAGEAEAKGVSAEEAIHHIDIGGPTMLRAAAKNWLHCASVVDPKDYELVLAGLSRGGLTQKERQTLAAKVFKTVSQYDSMIANYLSESQDKNQWFNEGATVNLTAKVVKSLRYGENPHQKAALLALGTQHGFADVEVLSGKEISYNNILDLDAASALVAEFEKPAVAIIKHTNPSGVAAGDLTVSELFQKAYDCDKKSAFGGIIAANRTIDEHAARLMTSFFCECVIAPDFTDSALDVFRKKPNLRVVKAKFLAEPLSGGLHLRSVRGALLVQDEDGGQFETDRWNSVTVTKPSSAQLEDLQFAMRVAKHVKSNAVIFAKNGVTLAVGAGQMSRIDSANIAVAKAKEVGFSLEGAVLASDAFFPFRDTVDFAAGLKIAAIVQPGGSMRDQESIDAANEHGITMVFTGERHFRH